MRRAYEKGFKYAHAICTALASTKIALNVSFERSIDQRQTRAAGLYLIFRPEWKRFLLTKSRK
jgi:hypothetical protein